MITKSNSTARSPRVGDGMVAPGLVRRAPRHALSLVSVDLARLAEAVTNATSIVDSVHACIMDGHFVPAVTIGPAVLADLRRYTSLPLECHLMADNVEGLAADLAEAGADSCVFHVEVASQPTRTVRMIRSMGMSVGVALRPNTPLSILEPLIDVVDTVLLTGVNTNRSRERWDLVRRVEQARAFIDTASRSVELHVEGRMDKLTTRHVAAAGADVLVLTQTPPRSLRSRE